MYFGYSKSIKSKVEPCSPEKFWKLFDNREVEAICAGIAEAREACSRSEMTKDKFDEFKNTQKRRLPILTPHATFKDGKRKNDHAIHAGLAPDLCLAGSHPAQWQGVGRGAEVDGR